MSKVCRKCGGTYGLDGFYKDRHKPDGLCTVCKECKNVTANLWHKNNPERSKAMKQAWADKNRNKVRASKRRWLQENPGKQLKYAKKWQQSNKGRVIAIVRAYQTRKNQRLAKWADLDAIQFFYECRPDGCHVDHVIPLKGKTVSGLHVETNLQWLPARENCRKGNEFPDGVDADDL